MQALDRRWFTVLRLLSILIITFGPALARADQGRPSSWPSSWLDKSQAIFLPAGVGHQLGDRQKFPIFWWDFLIFQESGPENGPKNGPKNGKDERARGAPDELKTMCARLQAGAFPAVRKSGCPTDLSQFQALVRDWARDMPLREPMPPKDRIERAFDETLSQASLPLGPSLLGILRVDPFRTFRELKERAEKRLEIRLSKTDGFYHDPATHRWVLPIQFAFPPNQARKTAEFLQSLSDPRWHLVGAHGANWENETQVLSDMSAVSFAGTALILLLATAALVRGRGRLLLLFPVVFSATAIGALVTVLVFGSIHGFTLSFGTGIIGLAIDYGLLSALNRRSPRTWRANLFGLLTTLAGLLILMSSSIPLLQQMMLFSSVGLSAAFLLLYVLSRRKPGWAEVRPVLVSLRRSRWRHGTALSLAAAGSVGLFFLRPSLDMAQLNFQRPATAELTHWLYPLIGTEAPLLEVSPAGPSALSEAAERAQWADQQGIPLENLARYLPPLERQKANLATWRERACGGWAEGLRSQDRKFFAPFLESVACDRLKVSSRDDVPAYLADFHASGQWLDLWLPKSAEQASRIQQRFPDALSLKQVVSLFPEVLSRELRWMAPASFLLAAFLLWIYYRRWVLVGVALVPFLAGVGTIAAAKLAFGLDFSFISLIGIVMVFGFSFDYGIFSTELEWGGDPVANSAVWTSLSFAALATVSGFLPLLLCGHPVLRQLGQTLSFGALGTYLGAVWGVPYLLSSVKKDEARRA